MKKNLLFSALCAVLLLAVWFVAAPQAPSAGPKSPEARVDGFRGDRKAEVDTVAGLGREAHEDPAATVLPTAATSGASDIEVVLLRFKNTEIPVETRQAEVEALGRVGDQQSWAALRALAGERVYLSAAAVRGYANLMAGEALVLILAHALDETGSPQAYFTHSRPFLNFTHDTYHRTSVALPS